MHAYLAEANDSWLKGVFSLMFCHLCYFISLKVVCYDDFSGIYFPTSSIASSHYRVLRCVPEDARCLNSRDKVPFILFLEIEYTGKMCGAEHLDQLDPFPTPMTPVTISMAATVAATATASMTPTIDLPVASTVTLESPKAAGKLSAAEKKARHRVMLRALVAAMMDSVSGVDIRARWSGPFSSYPACFVGSELVDWLLRSQSMAAVAAVVRCTTRADAVQVGRVLMLNGYIRHVRDELNFDDNDHYYSFVELKDVPLPAVEMGNVDDGDIDGEGDEEYVVVTPVDATAPSRSGTKPLAAASEATTVAAAGPVPVAKGPFGEAWAHRRARVQAVSPYGHLPRWDLISVIFKAGDDLRQERLCMQLIEYFDKVFKDANLSLRLRPYDILVTSPTSGLVETLPNAISVHSLKENLPPLQTLGMCAIHFSCLILSECRNIHVMEIF